MQTREEIEALVKAVNEDTFSPSLRLREEELGQLESALARNPELWPIGLVDTFTLLQRKLCWESIDRQRIPEPLLGFFDEKFQRDLDPMALARHIGQDICTSCADCGCRC
jgi:hypothetical protein